MDNETKWDVLEEALSPYKDGDVWHKKYLAELRARYDAALPDDLPVIPKAMGDVIVKLKHKRFSLSGAMTYAAVVSLSPWMTFEHEDTFARAWVLGVWRVEETGEIVKLEVQHD